MENDEERNIVFGEEIPFQLEDNNVHTDIEEGAESNYNVNKGELIEEDEQGMVDTYVTEEDE